MQPNFTLKKLRVLGFQFFAIALMLGLSTQFSYSQERVVSFPKDTKSAPQKSNVQQNSSVQKKSTVQNQDEIRRAKLEYQNRTQANVSSENDTGLPNITTQVNTPRTEAVCTTYVGSLAAGDPTFTSGRLNRNVVAQTCANAKTCPGNFNVGTTYRYKTYTFTELTGVAQCVTVTHTNTGVAGAGSPHLSIHNGPFNPSDICVNYLADQGGSPTPTNTGTFDFTIPANGTITLVLTETAVGGLGSYSISLDMANCGAPPCTTPAPGNTISTSSAVCPGVNFTLSLQNNPAATGLSWQWQSGPSATGPWTNVAGATSGTLVTNQSAATYYRCNVTCGATTVASTPVLVNLNPPSACYCDAGATSTSFEKIANVKFGTIDNSSTSTAGYENFTAISTDVIISQVLPITVTSSSTYNGDKVFVWIDFNKNGSFSDPGELVYAAPTNSAGPFTGNITISPSALTGSTRMRIRMADQLFGTQNNTPCGNTTWGQVEDYTVNILPCTPAIITSSPTSKTIACGGGTTFSVATAGNVASYQWERRADPTTVQTLTFTNNTPLAIPDNSGAGAYSTISVAGIPPGAVISNVSIRVNIDHTYVGDLENNIIAPNGVSMNLMGELDNGTGSNASDNFTNTVISSTSTVPLSGAPAPRTGTFGADRLQGYGPSANAQTLPNGMPWSALYTQLNGNWRLGVSDWYAGDVGTLNNWSITFTFTAPTAWVNVTDGGIYSGATTPTLTLSNVSQANTGNQYRAVINGICSGADVSSAATLTVNAVVPVVDPASATICLGTVQKLSLTNTLSSSQTATFSKTGLSTVLTNGEPAIVVDSVLVSGIPAGSVISNIQWGFNLTHTWASDVYHNVQSPTGKNLNMFAEIGGSTDDFIGTYFDRLSTNDIAAAPAPRTGIFAPQAYAITGAPPIFTTTTTNVNDMLVGDPNGYWKFAFFDGYAGDDGLLKDLFVNVTYTAPVFAQGTWTGPAGTMFTDATATTAYTGTPATTIYVKPTVSSNYQVSFTSATPCTSSTVTVPITVIAPITNPANPANTSVCLGGTATLSSATATGGPFVRQWQISTNSGLTWSDISGANSATLTLSGVTQSMNNNLYRVRYTAAPCAGTVFTTAAKLTVNPLPVVTIAAPDLALTPGQTTTITGTSNPAASTWSWTRDGAAIAGTTNTQTVNIDKLGSYQATVVDVQTPGCTAKSNILVIGSEASDRLWIYPNPTSGAFQVRLYFKSDLSEKRIVTIYNAAGQEITSRRFNLLNITAPYLQMDFDLTNMARGVYVVKVAHEFSEKVVSGLVVVN